MEYSLTTALKKVSIADKPKLGFIQGYGEPTIQAMPQLMEQLSVLYEVEPFRIKDTASVPSYYKALVWVAPMDTVKQLEFAKIDQYLDQGGGLFLAHEHVQGDLQQGLLSKSGDIGIKSWLAQKGPPVSGSNGDRCAMRHCQCTAAKWIYGHDISERIPPIFHSLITSRRVQLLKESRQ